MNDLTNQFATVADVTGIIAPLYESGTNVTVTSTQSVYSVAVTGAGPVGIDWSGLALDGTGRAEVTLRLHVTEWAGTNVTFSPALTFDQTPEILVTGVWEFAASTIDGVTTRVRQTWPECYGWSKLDSVYGVSANVGMLHDFAADQTNSITLSFMRETKMLIRYTIQVYTGGTAGFSVWMNYAQAGNTAFSAADIISARVLTTPSVGYYTMMGVAETKDASPRCVKLWIYPQGYPVRIYGGTVNYRPLNANERAAYAAGWRP